VAIDEKVCPAVTACVRRDPWFAPLPVGQAVVLLLHATWLPLWQLPLRM